MFDSKKFKKRVLIFSCIFIFVLSSLFLYKTYAKYISNLNKSMVAGVARPVIVYDGLSDNTTTSLTLPLEEMNPTSGIKTYTFDIINEDVTSITEVNLNYTVTISTTNNLPLNISISCNDVTPTTGSITSTTTGTILSTVFNGVFLHSQSATHTYTVEVAWQENMSDWQYANEIDELDIVVNWVQDGGA